MRRFLGKNIKIESVIFSKNREKWRNREDAKVHQNIMLCVEKTWKVVWTTYCDFFFQGRKKNLGFGLWKFEREGQDLVLDFGSWFWGQVLTFEGRFWVLKADFGVLEGPKTLKTWFWSFWVKSKTRSCAWFSYT